MHVGLYASEIEAAKAFDKVDYLDILPRESSDLHMFGAVTQ